MKAVYIYGLKDPRTGEIRYIGKSNNPQNRYKQHLAANDSNSHKCRWIKSLKKAGLRPELVILETTNQSEWEEKEIYWIEFALDAGWDITNIRAGGNAGFMENTIPQPNILEKFIRVIGFSGVFPHCISSLHLCKSSDLLVFRAIIALG